MPSAVTSIIGGIQGSSAAHHAATAVQQGYDRAGQTVQAGVDRANAGIGQAAAGAGTSVRTAAGDEGDRVLNTANNGALTLGNVAAQGANAVTGDANKYALYNIEAGRNAATQMDPYAWTGATATTTLGQALQEGGRLNDGPYTAQKMMASDPGYQFRVLEGQKALQRGLAASGMAGSGGALKAAARYGQGIASSEYGAAFDRHLAENNQFAQQLLAASAQGQQAAQYQGNAGMQAAQYAGQLNNNAQQFGAALNSQAAQQGTAMQNAAQQYAGNANLQGAEYQGNADMQSAAQQGANTLFGANFLANSQIGQGIAQGQGDIGAAGAWNGMLSGLGNAANSFIAGGLVPGGGWSWGGAFGAPQQQQPNPAVTNPNYGVDLTPKGYV